MNSQLPLGVIAAMLLCAALSSAQPPDARPLDERVAALEREIARVATRADLREAASTRGAVTSLGARVDELERSLARLTIDLQRIERQADTAYREATAASRAAQDAQRTARDAAMRR